MDAKRWIDNHEREFIKDICDQVRIPSVTESTGSQEAPFGTECLRALKAGLKLGERMGFEAFNHENYCGTLLWRGETKEELGFFGHLDVVPAGNGWSGDPFEPVVKDGIIIGRGASDNKGSMMSCLYALYYLKESGYRPKHSFRFFMGCSEEKGMEDVEYYAFHYEEPVFSIVPDVSYPVCCGEKGILQIQAECRKESCVLLSFHSGIMSNSVPGTASAVISVKAGEAQVENIRELGASVKKTEDGYEIGVEGIPAHAAFPEGSDSAEVKLARILLESDVLDETGADLMKAVVSFFEDYYGAGLGIAFEDEMSGKLTHVGGIASYENGVFWQDINIRYNITAEYEVLEANIKEKLGEQGFEMISVHNSNPCYMDKNSPMVTQLTDICNRFLGTELKAYVMGGGTYARKLKHAVGFGPGIPDRVKRFGSEKGGAHQADEYMEIECMKTAFEIYVEAIKALDRMDFNGCQ